MNDIFAPHVYSVDETKVSVEVREKASELLESMSNINTCRELSLAKTKLEESVMWANKALAFGGVAK